MRKSKRQMDLAQCTHAEAIKKIALIICISHLISMLKIQNPRDSKKTILKTILD
jgi:hypothetical protein